MRYNRYWRLKKIFFIGDRSNKCHVWTRLQTSGRWYLIFFLELGIPTNLKGTIPPSFAEVSFKARVELSVWICPSKLTLGEIKHETRWWSNFKISNQPLNQTQMDYYVIS